MEIKFKKVLGEYAVLVNGERHGRISRSYNRYTWRRWMFYPDGELEPFMEDDYFNVLKQKVREYLFSLYQ